jgi:hypothetical protein
VDAIVAACAVYGAYKLLEKLVAIVSYFLAPYKTGSGKYRHWADGD